MIMEEIKMKKYKVTNKLEQPIKFGKIIFKSKESKILDVKPDSDRFIIEEIKEEQEKEKKLKGGK